MHHFDTSTFQDRNGERYMLAMRIRELSNVLHDRYVVEREEDLGDFEFAEGDFTFRELAEKAVWSPFRAGVDRWGKPDQWVWFRQRVSIPAHLAGKDIWYYAYPFNEREVWYWGQPQLQLFVNGECVSGLDNCHRSYLLAKNVRGGEIFDIAIKAYSDLKYFKDTMTLISSLQVVRPEVYELYQSIVVPMKTASLMNIDSDGRIKIIRELNTACNILALDQDPDSDEFKESVRKASEYLKENLYGTYETGEEPVLYAIGHSHIDIAWQWTYHVSHNKAARTFATQLKLMELNPDYLFMSSQAQLYDFVKQDEPKLYEKIRKRVREGRWEPEGAMWVESDSNLVGGEALVRQFLFGKRFFLQEFGKDCRICWLPDIFGYSAALPQIAKRSGVPFFYTTKIGWNEYDKFPYDTFLWRGIDGSTLLTHFGCAKEYKETESDWMTTYNPDLEPPFVLGAWQRYQQKDLNREILYDFGYGDGGGGPTQEMIDYARRFEAGIPGCPKVKFAKALDFFEKLEKDLQGQKRVPVWDGEMYLEYHRGTYTSQAANKKANRKSEILFHAAENLASFALKLTGNAYPESKLSENWKLILLNQFHDVLPGSSITKVYEDSAVHYRKIRQAGNEMIGEAVGSLMNAITLPAPSVTVFNTLSHKRDALVILDETVSGLTSDDGQVIPCQKTHDGKLAFIAYDLPSKGWNSYHVSRPAPFENPINVTERSLENDRIISRFDEKMHLISLLDKKTGRELIPKGSYGHRIMAYEDRPPRDDAWNVQVYHDEKVTEINDIISVNVLEEGPVRGMIRVDYRFRDSSVALYISVTNGSPLLDFHYEIDWHENHYFVKAEYPVDVNTTKATYEIQFGYLERSITTNTLWDFGHFEASAHKYADLSDNSHGLSILNDCKYGYSVKRGLMAISLLKCATYPDPMQDQGHHSFSYALYAHEGDVISSSVRDLAYDYNYPVYAVYGKAHEGSLPEKYSIFSVSSSNVVLETVKKAEDSDDLILRLYEAENKQTDTELSIGLPFNSTYECDLMENEEKELASEGGRIALSFRPFEIKTVKVHG